MDAGEVAGKDDGSSERELACSSFTAASVGIAGVRPMASRREFAYGLLALAADSGSSPNVVRAHRIERMSTTLAASWRRPPSRPSGGGREGASFPWYWPRILLCATDASMDHSSGGCNSPRTTEQTLLPAKRTGKVIPFASTNA